MPEPEREVRFAGEGLATMAEGEAYVRARLGDEVDIAWHKGVMIVRRKDNPARGFSVDRFEFGWIEVFIPDAQPIPATTS